MSRTYQITEYGVFTRDKDIPGYVSLPKNTFDILENFILSNVESCAVDLMGISVKKGIGKVITAKNYVGVISLDDNTTIEILPKIYSSESVDVYKTKKLLVDMLKTLRNAPFKSLQTTNVNIENMDIFEIFIRMFIDEVFYIVKRGLKSGYESVESNEAFFKGKLLMDKQIQFNYAHKERSYVQYDEFNLNCVENKLLKSTLDYLYRTTSSSRNKKDLKTLLYSFGSVDLSTDYTSDFNKVVIDRHNNDYATALMWSRVFLQGKSFTSFSGSQVAFALLFPMESLFESYIAKILSRTLAGTDYSVSVHDRTYHLFDEPTHRFLIKPDIVLRNRITGKTFVMDTKWKLLSSQVSNYGIAQADMYQMYAYQKKYNADSVTLIYPYVDSLEDVNNISFVSDDGAVVKVFFVDLFRVEESLKGSLETLSSLC